MDQSLNGIEKYKTDYCFYRALSSVKRTFIMRMLLCFLQIVGLGVMVGLQKTQYQNEQDQVQSFFVIALIVSCFGFIGNFFHHSFLSKDRNCLILAAFTGHIVQEQNIHQINNHLKIPMWVNPQLYNVQNKISTAQANDRLKKTTEGPLQVLIKNRSFAMASCNKTIINFTQILSLALLIFGIVVLASYYTNAVQMGVMIGFIVIEFFAHIQVFLCLIVVALLPLLCILICFYSCCCGGEKKANLPPPVKATDAILNQSDSADCIICFQSLMVDEEVIVLPCSPKHVFHSMCIRNWVIVKPNCPVCRHDLTD